MYNEDFYDEDFLLEGKKKDNDDDDEEDGLLTKMKNRKREKMMNNPHYQDYRNKQIMSGKQVKSPEGWKEEEKRKKKLKRLAIVGGTALAAGAAIHHKRKNDPNHAVRYAIGKENATTANNIRGAANSDANYSKGFSKTNEKISRRNGVKDARDLDKYNRGGWFTKWRLRGSLKRRGLIENYMQILAENFTEEQLLECLDAPLNESKMKERWERQVEKKIENEEDFDSYKVYKKKYKARRRKLILGAAALAGGGYLAYDQHQKKIGNGNHAERKTRRMAIKAQNSREIANDTAARYVLNNSNYAHPSIKAKAINEELSQILPYQYDLYLETIFNDSEFMHKSYLRYCAMTEAQGLVPMDESVFSQAKKTLSTYTKTAVDALHAEKAKKEKEIERMQREKAERKAKEAKEEKERLKDMDPDERKAYLRKKRKEEEKEEEKEQDKHDLRQTFKRALVQGGGEELGKRAVKIATGFIGK